MSEATTTPSTETLATSTETKPSGVEALFPDPKAATPKVEGAAPANPAETKSEGGKEATTDKPTDPPVPTEKADGKSALGEESPPEAVKPEDYKFELPEGVTVDEGQLAETRTLFSSLNEGKGIAPKDAQAIVNAHLEAVKKADAAYMKQFNDQREAWHNELKADREMGGEKLTKEVIPAIMRAWNQVLSAPEIKELKQTLLTTGLDNHPGLVKALWKLSQPFVEGKGVVGKPVSPRGRDAGEILFPNNVPTSGA